MSIMVFLIELLHPDDGNDEIDILVWETNRYADQRIAKKADFQEYRVHIHVFATGFQRHLPKCLYLLEYILA